MLGASGPSLRPVGFGQTVAGGMQYEQQAMQNAAKSHLIQQQAARAGMVNDLLHRAVYGSNGPLSTPQASPQVTHATGAYYGPLDARNGTPGQSYAPAGTPQQNSNQQQNGSPQAGGLFQSMIGSPGGAYSFAVNPTGFTNAYMRNAFPAPSPIAVLQREAAQLPQGSPRRAQLEQAIAKAGYIAPTRLTGGGYMYDPATGKTQYLPRGTEGFNMAQDPRTGRWYETPVAGGPQAVYTRERAQSEAQNQARAANTPAQVIGPNGAPAYVTQAQIVGAANGGHPFQSGYTPEQTAQGSTFGKQNAAEFAATQKAAEAAQSSALSYQEALADAKEFKTGRFADVKGRALAVLNGLGVNVDPGALGSYQDMTKKLTGAALDRVRQLGSREAAQIVGMVTKSASPNAEMSPQGFAQIVSFMQASNYSKQAEAQAMQAWKDHGKDLQDFKSAWVRSDVPALLLYDRLTPEQQQRYKEANPEAVKQLRDGYNAAYHYGWIPLINGYQEGSR